MKTTVIHHSADFDGLFCREIARKFLPDAELIGWDYADGKIPFPEGTVYVLDLSPDCFTDFMEAPEGHKRLIWIDHHKSAIETHSPNISGYRIDGVAACRLAWFYFNAEKRYKEQTVTADFTWFQGHYPWATKQDFIDRTVSEPLAIRLAGEYDIWDKRDPNAELFQHGLRSRDLEGWWEGLLSDEAKATLREVEEMIDKGGPADLLPNGNVKIEGLGERMVANLLKRGEAIQYARAKETESVIQHNGFTIQFEGLTFLACNHARFNSHLFTAGLKPEHDACFGFRWDGKQWNVSLYHAPGKEHHDLSLIAVKHGGGGHKGACGFRAAKLPFLP